MLRIIKLLPRDRYRCAIATFKTAPAIGSLEAFDCPVHVLSVNRGDRLSPLKTALRLHALIRSERVNIVHTFFATSDLLGGLVAKLSGCKVISSRRDMGFMRSPKQSFAYRRLSGCFDQVQTVSDAVRGFSIGEDGLQPEKVVTVYNGVELNPQARRGSRDALLARIGLKEASHLVVSVGNVRPVKGYEVLIRCAARVCRELPKAVFVVAGEVHSQDYFGRLQELIRSQGLEENIRFLGLTQEVPFILGNSDVFCLLSHSEGFSNAILEAMASGLPCVVTRVGGNDEVVKEGKTGFLVEDGDADAAAAGVLALLHNPALAGQMGDAARRRVQSEFTTEAMVRSIVGHYDMLLANGAGDTHRTGR